MALPLCTPRAAEDLLPLSTVCTLSTALSFQLKPAGTACRGSGNSCDLPEFCTGVSPQCPANVYLHDGHPCQGVDGYCYNGICQTHEQQCVTLWGPGTWPPLAGCPAAGLGHFPLFRQIPPGACCLGRGRSWLRSGAGAMLGAGHAEVGSPVLSSERCVSTYGCAPWDEGHKQP